MEGIASLLPVPANGGRDFALGRFLARWAGLVSHDLSASESETLTLTALLGMAEPDDSDRWRTLDLGYAEPRGAVWLRGRIAARYRGMDAAHVLCCAGAQEGLTSVMRALLEPGDHAIVVVPIYQPSETAVTSLATATGVTLLDRDHWQLDVDAVAAAIRPETRLVLINFPNSPTGAAIDPAVLVSLVALCRRHGIWLVNDEIFRVVGDDMANEPLRVAELYERGISIDAVSKGFGLPGLRVGWVVCQDQALLARALQAKSALSSCLAKPSEVLASIALRADAGIVRRNKAIARSNRDNLAILLRCHADLFEEPVRVDGVLAFPRYRGPDGAECFARRLAIEAGVLVLPSVLWRSALAAVPEDHLRIGLGREEAGAALAALDQYLTAREKGGSA